MHGVCLCAFVVQVLMHICAYICAHAFFYYNYIHTVFRLRINLICSQLLMLLPTKCVFELM